MTPDPYFSKDDPFRPLVWMTDYVVEDPWPIYQSLVVSFPESGLWPVLLQPSQWSADIPWASGHFGFRARSRAEDATSHLAHSWVASVPDDPPETREAREAIEPFGASFPGLAPATAGVFDPLGCLNVITGVTPGHLGLVPVRRPAEFPEVVGLYGATNRDIPGEAFTYVLSSWEDRFGAVVVASQGDTLSLAVCRPPTTYDHAIHDASTWDFWWD